YSGYDQQWYDQHGWGTFPDRDAHGGADYLTWLLGELQRAESSAGRRLLDVFSVHFYPQGGEFSDDVFPTMQLRRNRSTRALWDPSYVDETWISDVVRLVPRLREWVAAHYPGTATAVTEYNWGAEGHITAANAIGRQPDLAVTGGAVNASLPAQSVTLFVVPAQPPDPAGLSIGDVTVTEGRRKVKATFTVTLSPPSAGTVTVGYATADGTA